VGSFNVDSCVKIFGKFVEYVVNVMCDEFCLGLYGMWFNMGKVDIVSPFFIKLILLLTYYL
jgi:hypothetical protein